MNAIEFVKKFGLVEAKKQLENPKLVYFAQVDYQFMHDLKQVVRAFEIVKYFGGINNAKYNLTNTCLSASELIGLKTAIELVEKCK